MWPTRFPLFVVAALALGGCATDHVAPPGLPRYGVILKNERADTLWETNVQFPGFTFYALPMGPRSGGLGPNVVRTYSFAQVPMTAEVTVTWRTEDGVHHRHQVRVPPALMPRGDDYIVFVFLPNDEIDVRRFSKRDFDKVLK